MIPIAITNQSRAFTSVLDWQTSHFIVLDADCGKQGKCPKYCYER